VFFAQAQHGHASEAEQVNNFLNGKNSASASAALCFNSIFFILL